MFFFLCLLNFLLIINSCTSDQLCIDSCEFEHDYQTNFNLPSKCNTIRRNQCSVILKFNYQTKIVTVNFGSQLHKQRLGDNYQTDNIISSVINLEEPTFIQHTVEYYCSTGDKCDLEYVQNIAIPLYSLKSCQNFRSKLIHYLHSNLSLSQRECFQSEHNISLCDQPCDLIYDNPDSIARGCDGRVDLTFQTKIGESTPINKPEYNHRSFSYGCTTQMCNGIVIQHEIQKLINLDDGECMIFLNKTTESTTSISLPTQQYNHAGTFSKSYILTIFIIVLVYFFP